MSITDAKAAFGHLLKEIRRTSKWPDLDDFSLQIGLSEGGYKKIEVGNRIASAEVLDRILTRIHLSEADKQTLTHLWMVAKSEQAGLPTPARQTHKVDCDVLATKIQNEVAYILKQMGLPMNDNAKRVVGKRVAMILKATKGLGE